MGIFVKIALQAESSFRFSRSYRELNVGLVLLHLNTIELYPRLACVRSQDGTAKERVITCLYEDFFKQLFLTIAG